MSRKDKHRVLDISKQTCKYPINEERFIELLNQNNTNGFVAELDTQIVGYVIYEALDDKFHILNIAAKHKEIAQILLDKIITKLQPNRRNRVTLEVRETILKDQLFYRNYGFKAIKVERNYYTDINDRGRSVTEDAYVMEYATDIDSLEPASC